MTKAYMICKVRKSDIINVLDEFYVLGSVNVDGVVDTTTSKVLDLYYVSVTFGSDDMSNAANSIVKLTKKGVELFELKTGAW